MSPLPSDLIVKWETETSADASARLAIAFDMLLRSEQREAGPNLEPLDNFPTAIKDQLD